MAVRRDADGGGLSPNGRVLTAEEDLAAVVREARVAAVIGMNPAAWRQELRLHEELFAQLAYHLPAELPATKARIADKLAA